MFEILCHVRNVHGERLLILLYLSIFENSKIERLLDYENFQKYFDIFKGEHMITVTFGEWCARS